MIEDILDRMPLSERDLERLQRRYPKDGRGFFSKRDILRTFRKLSVTRDLGTSDEDFAFLLRTCRTRSISGITPVTVLTKPFPCPGQCIFCPSDVRMPKSYLSDEPGCQRAEANNFDPYLQTWSRLQAYYDMGHPTEKIELIVLGGTWSYYPQSYRMWFITRLFDALNDFGERSHAYPAIANLTADFSKNTSSPVSSRGRYNEIVTSSLRSHHSGSLLADWEDSTQTKLESSKKANEIAGSRCVGLSVETRPDCVDSKELRFLRELGVTKVQIGVQSLSDSVLKANRRGHDVATTQRALHLLRRTGFKIHAHWMANLMGSTPNEDISDFKRLFRDRSVRPDELKVYPCSLIDSADLVKNYENGSWHPYSQDELELVLASCLTQVPSYCRVSRVIRDIPSPDIRVGNKHTNFRENVEERISREGGNLRDIRSREVRGESVDLEELSIRQQIYETSIGRELFLEYVTQKDRIVAFLRLSLPKSDSIFSELNDSALIREVHVYGGAMPLGKRSKGYPQHMGLGAKLINLGRSFAMKEGYRKVSVISAVGTRGYYRSLGFVDGKLYQHRPTDATS